MHGSPPDSANPLLAKLLRLADDYHTLTPEWSSSVAEVAAKAAGKDTDWLLSQIAAFDANIEVRRAALAEQDEEPSFQELADAAIAKRGSS